MNDLDFYLDIVNQEKIKKGLKNYVPLYPMFRVKSNKLYIAVLLTYEKENVWDKNEKVKPEYWVLLDTKDHKILEFNKTSDCDFVVGKLLLKSKENYQKEISKYTVQKTLQYQNYLLEDILKEELPIQKQLTAIFGSKFEIDNEKIDLNEYIYSTMEEEIKRKVKELVNTLILSKYSSLTFYYNFLFLQIIKEYQNNLCIDREKIKWCNKIMNYYYEGVIGIDNIFNLERMEEE